MGLSWNNTKEKFRGGRLLRRYCRNRGNDYYYSIFCSKKILLEIKERKFRDYRN